MLQRKSSLFEHARRVYTLTSMYVCVYVYNHGKQKITHLLQFLYHFYRFDTFIVENEVYLGEEGLRVWQNDWGCAGSPPIERDFGPGTRGSHFDEACLNNEIMTGFLNSQGGNPLSLLSIATLEDLGYQVDYSTAEDYTPKPACCQQGNTRKKNRLVRRLGVGWNKKSKTKHSTLSDLGLSEAMQYGRSAPRQNRRHKPAHRVNGDITFVGDLFLAVLYEEGGSIFEVIVVSDEN